MGEEDGGGAPEPVGDEPSSPWARRGRWWLAAAAASVLAVAAVVSWWVLRGDAPSDTGVAPVTSSSSTTTTAEPGPPEPDGLVAPLTGVRHVAADTPLLQRSALVVKIDNHPAAFPPWHLEDADIVIELLVEGISRFFAVYHSQDVETVGPVRSARTSDVDLTAMFGRPLYAWSGANPATSEIVRALPWVQSIDPARLGAAYSRDRSRRAPHNLRLDARRAFAAADDPTPPEPVFDYLAPGQPAPGVQVPGISVRVGGSVSNFVWDEPSGSWHRFSGPQRHPTASGAPYGVANVVVLETGYERSAADANSPEAVTVGSGRAWVLSDGRLVEGTWARAERTEPWRLLGPDGEPLALRPGMSFVVLSPAPPSPLDAARAAQLASG